MCPEACTSALHMLRAPGGPGTRTALFCHLALHAVLEKLEFVKLDAAWVAIGSIYQICQARAAAREWRGSRRERVQLAGMELQAPQHAEPSFTRVTLRIDDSEMGRCACVWCESSSAIVLLRTS